MQLVLLQSVTDGQRSKRRQHGQARLRLCLCLNLLQLLLLLQLVLLPLLHPLPRWVGSLLCGDVERCEGRLVLLLPLLLLSLGHLLHP